MDGESSSSDSYWSEENGMDDIALESRFEIRRTIRIRRRSGSGYDVTPLKLRDEEMSLRS